MIFTIFTGIIMVPMYLKYIGIEVYGAWLAAAVIINFIGLIESSLSTIFTQKLSHSYINNQNEFLSLSGSVIGIAVVYSLVALILGYVSSLFLPQLVNTPLSAVEDVQHALALLSIVVALTLSYSLIGTFLQVLQKTLYVGIATFISNVSGVIVIYLMLTNDYGVIAIASGFVIRAFLNLLFLITITSYFWKNFKLLKPTYSFDPTKKLIKYSFVPFLANVSNRFISGSHLFFIGVLFSPTLVTIFDITSKVIVACRMFITLLVPSSFAMLSLVLSNKNLKEINTVLHTLLLLLGSLSIAALSFSLVFSKSIVTFWVGLENYGGDLLLYLISVAFLFEEIGKAMNTLLAAAGKIEYAAYTSMIASFIYLFLIYVFNHTFGIYIFPLALFISSFLIFLINRSNFEKITGVIMKTKYFFDYRFVLAILLISLVYMNVSYGNIMSLAINITVFTSVVFILFVYVVKLKMKGLK